jgi:RNA polymerase sigma-70 factor (ECF subfamily)
MAVMPPDAASESSAGGETIEALFAALESPLLAYARRLLREPVAAEDVVQEAFMRLHCQFEEVRTPRAWLYRTVHNLALNHQRAAGKVVPLPSPNDAGDPPLADAADVQPLPDEQIIRLEGIGLVRLSLAVLDERSRELVRLKFHEDLSYAEISERTGLKSGHVGYLLHHALKAIAAELSKTGVLP